MIPDREPPALQSPIGLEGLDLTSLERIDGIDPASVRRIAAAIAAAQRTVHSKRTRAALAAAKERGQKLG
jgi:DNA invertase Pin-like site-specific DNA recombinase